MDQIRIIIANLCHQEIIFILKMSFILEHPVYTIVYWYQ
jgi:hypothetical protein